MKHLFTLLHKEFLIELRGAESLALTVCLSLLLSIIAGFGVSLSFLSPEAVLRTSPALIWIVFLFSATSATSRAFDYEASDGAIFGLLMCGVSPALIYFSKFISLSVLVLLGHVLSTLCISVLLGLSQPFQFFTEFMIISVLVTTAYSALAALLSAMVSASRLRSLLLPLILLPLLFPLFLGALELSGKLFVSGEFAIEAPWISALLGLDVIYLALGVNLYEHVIRE